MTRLATGTASASGDSGVFVDAVAGERESSSGEAMLRRSITAATALGDAVESMETIGSDLRAKVAEVREMLANSVGEQMLPRSLQVRLRSTALFAVGTAHRAGHFKMCAVQGRNATECRRVSARGSAR